MKTLFILLMFCSVYKAHAVWDFLQKGPAGKPYMNFFYKGYIPWFEKTFNTTLEFPGPEGKAFFLEAVNQLDHWKVPHHELFDQLLIGETFRDGKPAFTIAVYLHPAVKNHPYVKRMHLNFSPDFAEWDGKELCFSKFMNQNQIEHKCGNKTYFSKLDKKETNAFPNALAGLPEWEISTTSDGKVIKSFFLIKDLHMGLIPKEFYPYILKHGSATHMPFDKYSLDQNGMTVYYP